MSWRSTQLLAPALVTLALATSTHAAPPWPVALQTAVADEARRFDGEIALYVEELATGTRYTHNAATPSYQASGVKIVVMVAVFEAMAAGTLRWDEQLTYTKQALRDGAHVIRNKKKGDRFTVAELTQWMMHHSDNAATDMLINRLGAEAVNRAAQKYAGKGYGPITQIIDVRRQVYQRVHPAAASLTPAHVARVRGAKGPAARARQLGKVLGGKAGKVTKKQLVSAYHDYYDSGLNSASLEAVANILVGLVHGQVVDAESSQQMLEIMLGCHTGQRRIRAGLPAEVLLAHKTGTQHERLCDLGVYFPPDNRAVVLATCLKGFRSRKKAEAVVARLTREAHRLISRTAAAVPPPPTATDQPTAPAPRPTEPPGPTGPEDAAVLPPPQDAAARPALENDASTSVADR